MFFLQSSRSILAKFLISLKFYITLLRRNLKPNWKIYFKTSFLKISRLLYFWSADKILKGLCGEIYDTKMWLWKGIEKVPQILTREQWLIKHHFKPKLNEKGPFLLLLKEVLKFQNIFFSKNAGYLKINWVIFKLYLTRGLQAGTKWSQTRLNSRSRFYSNFYLCLE